MSLRETDDPDSFLSDFVGNGRAVSDYLTGEILCRLPSADRDLLAAVSICDQLSAPLASALSGRADAGEVLDALEHDTSLVLSTGEGRTWYRMHPLLRAHLHADLQRRRPDRLLQLNGMAADWYAARSRPGTALRYATDAQDPERVAALVRRGAAALVAGGELGVLQDSLAWLGDHAVRTDPWLALVAALVDLESGATAAADAHLAEADAVWPSDAGRQLLGLRTLVQARRIGLTGDPAEMVRATTAFDPAVGDELGLAVMGNLDRALALLSAGRREEARTVAESAVERAQHLGQSFHTARALTVLGAVAGALGDYGRMLELVERGDAALPDREPRPTANTALAATLRAYGALLRAQPATCLELADPALLFADGPRPRPSTAIYAVVRAYRGAALVDLGHGQDGLGELREARIAAGDTPGAHDITAIVALLEQAAAVSLGRHDLARTALAWSERALGVTGDVLLMRARRLSELGRHDAAADMLIPLLDGTVAPVVPWTVIEALVLDCRLALARDRRAHAHRSLDRALELAAQRHVLRPLVLGPAAVVELLTRQLGSYDGLESTALRILATRNGLGSDAQPIALTDRERAVLRHLPTQRSFEEIAVDLTVSRSTVKTHVRSIYGKLGVNSRREAVASARRHGLLSVGPD